MKFACDSMLPAEGNIASKWEGPNGLRRTLLRGINNDAGYWFVMEGNFATRFPNLKMATDALMAKDAGLPDAHEEGKHYQDKPNEDFHHERGVRSGMPGKLADGKTVAGPTGTFVTRPLEDEEEEKAEAEGTSYAGEGGESNKGDRDGGGGGFQEGGTKSPSGGENVVSSPSAGNVGSKSESVKSSYRHLGTYAKPGVPQTGAGPAEDDEFDKRF